jgi:site-specific recombinase XerD
MNHDDNPADVLSPGAARHRFLNAKQGTVKDSTFRAYRFPTRDFIEFCGNQGIETIGEVSNYLIELWIQKRETEVKPITVNQNVRLLRVFVKWCERNDLVNGGTYDKVRVPNVPEEEEVSDVTIKPHTVTQITDHLSTYEYASRKHVAFKFIWETACRASGLISVDMDDVGRDNQGDPCVEFVNRKSAGTPLKNGNKSERLISISDPLFSLLDDYIDFHRENVEDEYGRKPLFTTRAGRVSRQRLYKDTVAFTRPCVYSGRCPAGREISECEPAQKKKSASSCPENISLHPIRRGSITAHINRGWEKELLSERVDVSVEVLEKHYDARTKEEALRRRKEYRDMI